MSFEEFVNILSNMTDATAESSADQEERELRDAFRVFDKHNRGYITASDLRAVLQCLGEDLDEDESKLLLKWDFQAILIASPLLLALEKYRTFTVYSF